MSKPAVCQALYWLAYNTSFSPQNGGTHEVGAGEETRPRGATAGVSVQTWGPLLHVLP